MFLRDSLTMHCVTKELEEGTVDLSHKLFACLRQIMC